MPKTTAVLLVSGGGGEAAFECLTPCPGTQLPSHNANVWLCIYSGRRPSWLCALYMWLLRFSTSSTKHPLQKHTHKRQCTCPLVVYIYTHLRYIYICTYKYIYARPDGLGPGWWIYGQNYNCTPFDASKRSFGRLYIPRFVRHSQDHESWKHFRHTHTSSRI